MKKNLSSGILKMIHYVLQGNKQYFYIIDSLTPNDVNRENQHSRAVLRRIKDCGLYHVMLMF